MYPKICLIGDVIVDVSLKSADVPLKLRLGGIIHAARGLWALGVPFSIAYFAPAYLDDEIVNYCTQLGCENILKIGNIKGSPYVFLIDNVKETGNQGYEFLLRDSVKIQYNENIIKSISGYLFDEIFIISGNYDLEQILINVNANVHIDVANNVLDFDYFEKFKQKFKTIFLSTSSDLFSKYFEEEYLDFVMRFKNFGELIVLKENRGGSRAFSFESKKTISIPSQTQPIIHSVGVGDVYGACYVANYTDLGETNALFLSSWIAAEYAKTTFPDDLQRDVKRLLDVDIVELKNMEGVSLPWEKRKNIHIYIAAPDFNFIDVTPIDTIVENLTYHNFVAHRPIKENGQMEQNASKTRRQELFTSDMVLIGKCSILVAVMLYNDPGTLIEIGIASAMGMPTIVYDPYRQATNCMLTELPTLLSSDLDIIISEVFIQASKLNKK